MSINKELLAELWQGNGFDTDDLKTLGRLISRARSPQLIQFLNSIKADLVAYLNGERSDSGVRTGSAVGDVQSHKA